MAGKNFVRTIGRKPFLARAHIVIFAFVDMFFLARWRIIDEGRRRSTFFLNFPENREGRENRPQLRCGNALQTPIPRQREQSQSPTPVGGEGGGEDGTRCVQVLKSQAASNKKSELLILDPCTLELAAKRPHMRSPNTCSGKTHASGVRADNRPGVSFAKTSSQK
jgi:hypothetical protein